MSLNRWNNRRKKNKRPCEKMHADDGIDPRSFFRGERPRKHRKTLQLCGQIGKTLNCVMGECGDSRLYGLMVESVEPAPDSSCVRVWVSSMEPQAEPTELLTLLCKKRSFFKEEIARAIHRKRVPELIFQFTAVEAPGSQAGAELDLAQSLLEEWQESLR